MKNNLMLILIAAIILSPAISFANGNSVSMSNFDKRNCHLQKELKEAYQKYAVKIEFNRINAKTFD